MKGYFSDLAAKTLGQISEPIQPRLPGRFEPETNPGRPLHQALSHSISEEMNVPIGAADERSLSTFSKSKINFPARMRPQAAARETNEFPGLSRTTPLSETGELSHEQANHPDALRRPASEARADASGEIRRDEGNRVSIPPPPRARFERQSHREDRLDREHDFAGRQNRATARADRDEIEPAPGRKQVAIEFGSVAEDKTRQPLPAGAGRPGKVERENKNPAGEGASPKPLALSSPESSGERVETPGGDPGRSERPLLVPALVRLMERPADPKTMGEGICPEAPAIRVTIGRIEVRAVIPPPPPLPRPASAVNRPKLSLEEYLNQRQAGTR
jgi:hypothetical protein